MDDLERFLCITGTNFYLSERLHEISLTKKRKYITILNAEGGGWSPEREERPGTRCSLNCDNDKGDW